jgi:hypothetical protein
VSDAIRTSGKPPTASVPDVGASGLSAWASGALAVEDWPADVTPIAGNRDSCFLCTKRERARLAKATRTDLDPIHSTERT